MSDGPKLLLLMLTCAHCGATRNTLTSTADRNDKWMRAKSDCHDEDECMKHKYHVTYYYCATGMEGIADEHDYGIIEADSPDAACIAVGKRINPSAGRYEAEFIMSCLTAKEVA